MDKIFWQGKKVVVTGSSGFVGSQVINRLLDLGAFVVGISRTANSNIKSENFIFKKHDLQDIKSLTEIFKQYNCDTVIHLAAAAIVNQAALNPVPTIQSNVLGTLNILEAARVSQIKRVVVASSDKTYGDHSRDLAEPLPFNESYALKGLDIYSSSKVCADMLSQAYAFQYKFPIMVARCCNIYGPGDLNLTRLIPKTVMLLLSGKPPTIKSGHENVLREYIFIDDAVDAYLLLAELAESYYGPNGSQIPKKSQEPFGWACFNVGSYTKLQTQKLADCPNVKSVTDVINLLREQISDIEPIVTESPPQYIEIPDEYSDCSKLLGLGFRPKINFNEGITKAVTWYKLNYDKVLKH